MKKKETIELRPLRKNIHTCLDNRGGNAVYRLGQTQAGTIRKERSMNQQRIFFALLTGIFLLSGTPQVFAQDDIIKERKGLMKANSKTSKALKKAVKAMDYAAIESGTKVILANMEKLPTLLPKGSTSKKSRALKTIWTDWQGVTDNIGWVRNSAKNLAAAAAAKDNDLVKLEYQAVSTACSQCHRSYRKGSRGGKKKKKK